mgnify:FL=1
MVFGKGVRREPLLKMLLACLKVRKVKCESCTTQQFACHKKLTRVFLRNNYRDVTKFVPRRVSQQASKQVYTRTTLSILYHTRYTDLQHVV